MCVFTSDYDRSKAGYSPDRMYALVWPMAELGVETSPGDDLSEFYRRKKLEEAKAH